MKIFFKVSILSELLVFFIIGDIFPQEIPIPSQSDWVDQGVVLSNGPSGSWDKRLYGMISPCVVIKKNGTYFLYYLGADGNRSSDNGPRHRALGVATSTDGINYTKYSGNPIITFLPNNNEEEGVFSAAGLLDTNDDFVLFYGAMDAGSPTSGSVNSDVRLAISSDGYNFSDKGIVLDHDDGSVWNSGDELFPLGIYKHNGIWNLFYTSDDWELGLAWGPSSSNLSNSQGIISSGDDIISGGDPIWLSNNKIAVLIVRDFDSNYIEARTTLMSSPTQISAPVESYSFNGYRHQTTFFDNETNTWYMFNRKRKGNEVRLRTFEISTTGVSDEREGYVPDKLKLHQNYPNPFNPNTSIEYQIPQTGKVNLTIYNTLGEKIRILTDQYMTPGIYKVNWNGLDSTNNFVGSGVYVYQFSFLGEQEHIYKINRKMLLVK